MNSAQLIQAIATGDRKSFETLYRSFQRPMLAYAIGLLAGDRELAEDAVDEAFLNIWDKAAGYSGTGSAEGWIRRIVRNKAVDLLRRQKSARTDQWSPTHDQIAEKTPSPEELVANSNDALWLKTKLASLPLDQREAIFLCYFEDLTVAAIAQIANCPEGTVKTRLFHARKALRGQMVDLLQQTPMMSVEMRA